MSHFLLRFRRSLGIRAQLTLLYTAVFAVLILLFGVIFYTALSASLTVNVDSALQLRSQQIASGIGYNDGNIAVQDVTGELPGLASNGSAGQETNQTGGATGTGQSGPRSDVNIGTLVRVLNIKGKVAYVSPAFRFLSLPSASISQPLHGVSWQGTVMASDGQTVRLYSVALTDNGTVYGVLQVGQSLAQLTATLQSITVALLVIAPFILLLSALGSYWLAKRAFRPILHLTRTARDIKAGDLHRRVPVPQARDEVYALATTFNEMIGRLDMAFSQQRRFVADASHELRTPVAVIRSITDVTMEQSLNPEEYVAVLQDINAEAERLGLLINDLLALARADEGQTVLDSEPVRLDLLTTDVVTTMEPLATEHDIALREGKLEPVTVEGDTARLIQVLMALVDNALTYTNAGGTVTLSVEQSDGHARFSICDTGIGIAPQDVPHIFERFYRADPARSRAAGGSGLGLAIVDWVIHAHGGTISVESQLGHGSTFTIEFPLAAWEIASRGKPTLEQSRFV